MNISPSLLNTSLTISSLVANDLPEPGEPNTKEFLFFNKSLSIIITLPVKEFIP